MGRKSHIGKVQLALLTFVTGCALVLVALGEERKGAEGGALANARIEIYKAERKLLLFSGESLVGTYPVGLGFQPTGSKTRQGDGATPEGEYFVCVKNPQSRYFLSFGLNYPNSRDASVGFEGGLLTADQQQSIARAEERGGCPPWNTDLGGEIYIHGRGAGADWTLGCIALNDPDMKRLFDAVQIGTRVTIKP
jgi:murein L,D-transpeptidase YafK